MWYGDGMGRIIDGKSRFVADYTYEDEEKLKQEGPAEVFARMQRFIGHSAVNFDRAKELADLRTTLQWVHRHLPKVRAWCVMKHYTDRDGHAWKPTVWCACKTRVQADAFAKAIKAHYDERTHGGTSDRFLVEHGEASVIDLIDPSCTPELYVAWLGR